MEGVAFVSIVAFLLACILPPLFAVLDAERAEEVAKEKRLEERLSILERGKTTLPVEPTSERTR